MRITKKWLEERGACAAHVRIFARQWPTGGEMNRENLERAAQLGLRLGWLQNHLSLPQPAREECDRVIQAAQEECDRVTQEALITLILSAAVGAAASEP